MVTTVQYPDLTTTTPTVTVTLVGDVDLVDLTQTFVNKKTGVGTAIFRGNILGKDASVTPNGFKVAVAGDLRPVVVGGLPTNTWDYNNPTRTASDADSKVQVITGGRVVLTAGGSIQPGSKVQAAGSNKVVAWDATAGKDIGMYLGKPGQLGGNVTATAAADNDLIWVQFNGGGVA
jgi:hypothetical protein